MSDDGPHQSQSLVTGGADPAEANAAVVAVHGRGATARSILQMAQQVSHGREDVTLLAPQAARNTWYPNSFLEPMTENQPSLGSAFRALEAAIETATDAGIPAEKVLVMGFSQGACLSSEYLARHARRYGGFVAFSGGLHGPEGTPRDYEGSFDGTPMFLGCSDRDPHIPLERVHETRDVFEGMDAEVDERIYEAMGHGVNDEEVRVATEMVSNL
ncbi:alpha/beta hydrolase [Halomarina oriensis]|uniref:PE-PPE domain-containing protein n=1 Tax=Halomarina oriensis TaxID=671145 RepID=A0A6B0GPE5_9EURY|nr:dienelactone hydrolase family protein [Halomarina oriensis]MWG35861.1 PE-PPE domain-containing protein [Halomarina oriensis]